MKLRYPSPTDNGDTTITNQGKPLAPVQDRLEEPVPNRTQVDRVSAISNFGEAEPNVGDLASMGRPSTWNILIQPEAEAQEEAGTSISATETLENDRRQLQRQPTEASGVGRSGREREAAKRLDL